MNIYVGNLNYKSTEDQVRQLFSEFGEIASMKLMKDFNGQSRGFAFVEMEDGAAQAAISKLNGFLFMDKTLQVNEARPKPAPGSGGGRSGYGDRGGNRGGYGDRGGNRGGYGDRNNDRGGYGGRSSNDRGGYGGDRNNDRGGYGGDRNNDRGGDKRDFNRNDNFNRKDDNNRY